MPKIVQFTHPGAEHQPEKSNLNHKEWNQGSHKRKFLNCKGLYIDEYKRLQESSLMFWGEWEPPSYVSKLERPDNDFRYPEWLHKPYLPEQPPVSKGYQTSFQNTDPFVFGDSFKYFVCKQFKPKSKIITPLASLDAGSLILFGSTHGKNKDDSFFQLDTVFVVNDYEEYNTSDVRLLKDKIPEDYYKFVVKMAFPELSDSGFQLRLYFGATYDNRFNEMYSFSPSKIYKEDRVGFPRVKLKKNCFENIGSKYEDYITNNLNSGPKISNVEPEEIFNFWKMIRDISREQGCVEGVKFNI